MLEAYFLNIIRDYIYLGTFFLMFLETIFPPLPSEIIMPFAGYLASYLKLSIFEIIFLILCGNIGATLGATLIYFISLKFGRKFILKYGKYFFIDKEKILSSEKWFERYGGKVVFTCRLLPGMRSLISIPAGIVKMDFKKFLILTFFGSLIWTTFLFYLGYILKEIFKIARILELFGILILISVLFYIIFNILRKKFESL